MRAKGCSDNPVRSVLHAPDNVGAQFAMKRTGVGESGNIFADLVGDGFVVLELHPFCLGWQGGQLAYESLELRAVHHAVSPWILIFPVTAAAMSAARRSLSRAMVRSVAARSASNLAVSAVIWATMAACSVRAGTGRNISPKSGN